MKTGAPPQTKTKSGQSKRQKKRDRLVRNQRNRHATENPTHRQIYKVDLSGDPKSITLRVRKNRVRCLVDTGAQVSLISDKMLHKLFKYPSIQATKTTLSSASGDTLHVRGQVELEFSIGGKHYSYPFKVVTNLSQSIIMGADFMTDHGVRIYYDKRQIVVGGVAVPFERDMYFASLVRICHTTVIKPQTAVRLLVKRKDAPYFREGQELEIVSSEQGYLAQEPGLMVSNTLVTNNKTGRFPLLIANNTNKTVKLRRGWVVGQLSAVEHVQVCSLQQNPPDSAPKQKSPLDETEIDAPQCHLPKVKQLVGKHSHLFANCDSELGQTDSVKCTINTGTSEPVKIRPYRTPLQDRETVSKAIEEWEKAKIIRRSQSPWSSSLVVVGKKDGTKRICVDYRKLNEVTKKSSYPLPLIDDLLSLLGKAKYFTSLDLKSGYYQVKVAEEDKEKTAFSTFKGQWEWNTMPFGLCNAPNVFMQLMDVVLEGLESFAVAYIDDILIFSTTLEEHWEHIATVFARLEQHNLKMKLKKCQFLRDEINYLGFVVTKDGIKPEAEKVRAIRDMKPPTTVREVRSLMGTASYYRRFIPNFTKIAEPIIALTKKYARFQWTPDCQRAFEFLKESLTVVPLLAYPDTSKPYVLYTDASDTCIGACLTQMQEMKDAEGKVEEMEVPIYFLSHKLSHSQTKWATIEKEAFAIHYALQKLDHYLHNSQFVIKTDHQPLKYLLNSPMQNRKVQLWALGLAGYNATVEYIPGEKNVLADLLSRLPDDSPSPPDDQNAEPREISDNTYEINVLNSTGLSTKQFVSVPPPEEGKVKVCPVELQGYDMITEQNKDPELVKIREQIGQPSAPKTVQKRYLLIEGIMHFISDPDDDPKIRLVVPAHLVEKLLQQYHIDNGHGGIDTTHDTLKQKYFWPGMYKQIYKYVSECVTCQTRILRKAQAPIQEMDVPQYPFAKVSLDMSGPYPRTQSGNRYIVSFVDHFSGWPEAFAVPDKTADTVVQLLAEQIIPRHSCPLQIVTDNGTENENKVMRETLREMNIDHVTTSYYHPQSNSKAERFHRTLHDVLSKLSQDNLDMWDVFLEQTLSAVRVSSSETTGHSPFYLLYNRDPVLPLDNILRPRRRYTGEELHKIIIENQHRMYTQVHNRIRKSQAKSRDKANAKRTPVELQVGDPVYVRKHQRSGKLDQKWRAYFRITKKLTPTSFLVRNQLDGTQHKVHADHLVKAKIHEWTIPPADETQRPLRRAQRPVNPGSDSSSQEEGDSETSGDEITPPERQTRLRRQVREDFSDEDDIPLAELQHRLKERERMREELRQEEEDSQSEAEGETEEEEGMEVDHIANKVVKDKPLSDPAPMLGSKRNAKKGSDVKLLLKAISSLL